MEPFHLEMGETAKMLLHVTGSKSFSVRAFKAAIDAKLVDMHHKLDGLVTDRELLEILTSFGMEPDRARSNVAQFFEYHDVADTGRVSIKEYAIEFVHRVSFRFVNSIRRHFMDIDVDHSKSIERKELLEALARSDFFKSEAEARDAVEMVFLEVDADKNGKLTLEELEEWYRVHAKEQRRAREEAEHARAYLHSGHYNKGIIKKPSPRAGAQRAKPLSFERKFYPVEELSGQLSAKRCKHELAHVDLSDVADSETEVPGLFDVVSEAYDEMSQLFDYYASIRVFQPVREIQTLNLDQLKKLFDDCNLGVHISVVENIFDRMKRSKKKPGSASVARARASVSRSEFLELVVRVAAAHKDASPDKGKDIIQWLLDVWQLRMRDVCLKKVSDEYKVRRRLLSGSVQRIYHGAIEKLWKAYNKHALNVRAKATVDHPLSMAGMQRLFAECWPEQKVRKRDMVHWYLMSRDARSRSVMVNGAAVLWPEFLEIVARFARNAFPDAGSCAAALGLAMKQFRLPAGSAARRPSVGFRSPQDGKSG